MIEDGEPLRNDQEILPLSQSEDGEPLRNDQEILPLFHSTLLDNEIPVIELGQSVSEASTINQLIAKGTDDTFKVGNMYDSLDCLRISVENFAKEHHFEVRTGGRKIHCYRGYQCKYERDRERTNKTKPGIKKRSRVSTMKCDCQWYLTYKQVRNQGNNVPNDTDTTNLENTTTNPKTMKIMLTKVSNLHNHEPSLHEKQIVTPKSTRPKHKLH